MKYIVCKNAEDAIKKCKNGLNIKHFQPSSKNLRPTSKNLRPTSKNLQKPPNTASLCSLLSVKQNSF